MCGSACVDETVRLGDGDLVKHATSPTSSEAAGVRPRRNSGFLCLGLIGGPVGRRPFFAQQYSLMDANGLLHYLCACQVIRGYASTADAVRRLFAEGNKGSLSVYVGSPSPGEGRVAVSMESQRCHGLPCNV